MVKGWLANTSTQKLSPEALLIRYTQKRDNTSLNLLVQHFNLMLYHYLLSQSEQIIAEEVLQNTWLKVINNAQSFTHRTSVKSWLFTIARHTLIDELRRQQRWNFQEIEDNHLASINLSEQFIQVEQLEQFNTIIAQLPFYQREAFILQQEGCSLAEIAIITDEKKETIKTRLRYAKQNLKQYLEPRQ
jgi:RNA polymerase sigma-70 factor (ECF subfamily)